MNNEPKKHHYLPQSYLKGFQINNTKKNPEIYVYEKDNKKTPYIAAIKDTACIRDYHTIKVNDKNDRTSIEALFSDIENEIIQNIRRVINDNYIDDDSKITFAITILFFKSRVPQNLETLRKFAQQNLEWIAEENFKINNMGLKGTFGDNFKLTVNNNLPLSMMMNSLFDEEIIAKLCCMYFSLLKAPNENYFVCSDAPVSYFVPNYNSNRGVGLCCPTLQIFLPLNKSYGLLCSYNKTTENKELSIEELNEYNRRTIITAEKYIYGSEINTNIQKIILDNKDKFSGISYNVFETPEGRFQYAPYIPVTS